MKTFVWNLKELKKPSCSNLYTPEKNQNNFSSNDKLNNVTKGDVTQDATNTQDEKMGLKSIMGVGNSIFNKLQKVHRLYSAFQEKKKIIKTNIL